MVHCWAEDPAARPSFTEILRELHSMGKQLKERSRRRRSQRGPAAAGAGGAAAGRGVEAELGEGAEREEQ